MMFDKDRITFFANGKWKGGGVIPAGLQRIEDFSAWIAAFVGYCRRLGKDYAFFSANDGALVGQEKASLAGSLEGLIGVLLVFRQYISEEKPKSFKSLENDGAFSFSAEIGHNSWSGQGFGPLDGGARVRDFAGWYNDVLLQKLGEAIRSFAQAQADGTISPDESAGLVLLVEGIIADVLSIDRLLVTEDLSR